MASKRPKDLKMIKSWKLPTAVYLIKFLILSGYIFSTSSCSFSEGGNSRDQDSLSPTPIPNVFFFDDFSDSSSGWYQLDVPEGIADYENGKYLIGVHTSNTDFWSTPGISILDVIIDVDASLGSGTSDNNFGVICRYQDNYNFYFFIISSDGYYGIGKIVDGEQTLIGTEKMVPSSAINVGSENNHIKAICDHSDLRLIVNDVLIMNVKDSSFKSGDVGLLTGTFSDSHTYVYFDNFSVKKP